MKTINISISTDFIKLDQLLKFSGLIDSGGLAKQIILDGYIDFNGEVCYERGKKVRPGDTVSIIELFDEDYTILVESEN